MVSNLTVKVGADIQGLQKELQKATGQLQGFGKNMKAVGGLIAGAFAASELISFGKGIFNVTAEFQKFEAVLTNTLGHNGAAKAALEQITQFAIKTPFQVNELTASFVKLANQGFIPTLDQMKSLGDLASAMGKSFDQLTEAIIDAQTGEFERLKEFGIRASKQGDQVTFTFKGVKKQVDFTADSIRQYILSLGQVEGVSGGMEAQSKTLGGGLSNLKDAFDQLQLAIGKSAESGGVFSFMLDQIAKGVKGLTNVFKEPTMQQNIDALVQLKAARHRAAMDGDIKLWGDLNKVIQAGTERIREWKEGQDKLAELQGTHAIKAQTQSVRELVAEWDRLNRAQSASPTVTTKTGSDFLFDTGALTTLANAGGSALSKLSGHLKINSMDFQVWAAGVSASTQQLAEKIQLDFMPVIQNALSGIGQALGNAMNGSANFGDSLLKVLGGVLVQLGEMLLTVGLGLEAFKASLTSLNPAVAIGAGIALIAIGTAVAGSIKSMGSSSGSSGRSSSGRGSSSTGSLGGSGLEIKLGGELRIQGTDLVYIFNRQNQLNGRTRG